MQNPIVKYFETFSDEFATYEEKSQSGYSFNDWASMLNNAAWSAGFGTLAWQATTVGPDGHFFLYSITALLYGLAMTLALSATFIAAEAVCQGWRHWSTIWLARFVFFGTFVVGGIGINYLVPYILTLAA